jgi:carbonic anhydrase
LRTTLAAKSRPRRLCFWFTSPMSVIDRLLPANEAYAATFPGLTPRQPRLRLAVVACMDSRLDLFGALGLTVGDAHIIRNAGGLPTDDVLRSLALSQRLLGTREIMLIHHTDCGMQHFDDAAFRSDLAAESGDEPHWDVPGFRDLSERVLESISVVRRCGWLPHRDDVRGFVFDVATGGISEIAELF